MAPKADSRFSALSTLRAKRTEEVFTQENVESREPSHLNKQGQEESSANGNTSTNTAQVIPTTLGTPIPEKKGPGRPRGRRSNPNYTQVSAYIPLELLLNVQDALAQEQRQARQRTARPVSDLVEELLVNWLGRQSENTHNF